jgi:cytochrome c553
MRRAAIMPAGAAALAVLLAAGAARAAEDESALRDGAAAPACASCDNRHRALQRLQKARGTPAPPAESTVAPPLSRNEGS